MYQVETSNPIDIAKQANVLRDKSENGQVFSNSYQRYKRICKSKE